MLTQEDKNKILELRSKNFSYKAIHNELGFSPATIMKVCKEKLEIKEIKSYKGENRQIEADLIQKHSVSYNNLMPKVRKIENDIDALIKSGKLKSGARREWEKRLRDITKIMKEEVDDIVADAVKAKEEELKRLIESNYVNNEFVTNLINTLKGKNVEIINLKKINENFIKILRDKDSEISEINVIYNSLLEKTNKIFLGMLKESNDLEKMLINYKKLIRKLIGEGKVDKKLIEKFKIDI